MRRLVLPYGQSSSELLDHSQRRFLFKNVGCIPPACPSVIIDSSDQHPEHLHRRHARAPLIPLLAHGPRCTLPSSSTSTLSSPRFLIPTRPSVLSQPLRRPRNSVCISCLFCSPSPDCYCSTHPTLRYLYVPQLVLSPILMYVLYVTTFTVCAYLNRYADSYKSSAHWDRRMKSSRSR